MAMRMCKIYRLEHPVTGQGVFTSVGISNEVKIALRAIYDVATEFKHPSPQEDIYPRYYERFWNPVYFCACPDMDSLKQWFSGSILDVLQTEFNLLEITIPKKFVRFGISGIQAFYKKEDIVSIKILNKK